MDNVLSHGNRLMPLNGGFQPSVGIFFAEGFSRMIMKYGVG